MPTFFEFFAGGGMARAGLEHWQCLFANDFDHKKGETYRQNWPGDHLLVEDVKKLTVGDLPTEEPDLIWASFPCQDLSLAGAGAGLKGDRSGTFWPFWRLIAGMATSGRKPKMIALENVLGTLTSHGGKDFSAIIDAFVDAGYRVGALMIDAELFVPHSRPRLFFVGVLDDRPIADSLMLNAPESPFHPSALCRAHANLSDRGKEAWVWWSLPTPPKRKSRLIDIVEAEPTDVSWHSPEETDRLLSMMAPLHRAKLNKAVESKARAVGAAYRRTRRNQHDEPVQRAEVRFDDVAGCLRTPAGGSSRQLLILVEDGKVRSRLISGRETARLMGLPETYKLPARYNETYHLTGDGIVVDAVAHLNRYILRPLAESEISQREAA